MSEDESVVFFVSLGLAAVFWIRWWYQGLAVSWLGERSRGRPWLLGAPLFCGVMLWYVLRYLASFDVRDSTLYVAFYMALGAAWVGGVVRLTSLLGISFRDDALERRNPAATAVITGAMVGFTAAFAGGNIGDGPGWWVVVYCALLATGGLLILWTLLEWMGQLAESITVERDLASGIRLGGFLVAAGLVLGRAVAGDWHSLAATHRDFARLAWPAVLLAALAALTDAFCRLSGERPAPSPGFCGALPAVLFIGIACTWLVLVGWPQ
jgi:hypothetical protein